jgi:hypothetical protein
MLKLLARFYVILLHNLELKVAQPRDFLLLQRAFIASIELQRVDDVDTRVLVGQERRCLVRVDEGYALV